MDRRMGFPAYKIECQDYEHTPVDSATGTRALLDARVAINNSDLAEVNAVTAETTMRLFSHGTTVEWDTRVHASAERLPPVSVEDDTSGSARGFIDDRGLRAAVDRIGELATRAFGSDDLVFEEFLEFDPVLGGEYVALQILVPSRDRDLYRTQRKNLEELVASTIQTGVMKHFVLTPRLNA